MRIPPIDPFSFVFGFMSALILLFIITRIIKLQPQIKTARQNRKQKKLLNNAGECERTYKQFMLKKCQRSHLASPLFPLNEIYIDLGLVSHPFLKDPGYLRENEPLLFQNFPIYLGDGEEYSDLPAPLLTLEQALSGGRNVMIMNAIGTGKTTLLAQFASKIIEGKSKIESFNHSLPVFINISDLNYQNFTQLNLFEQIANKLHEEEPKINPDLLFQIFSQFLAEKSLILIIDGLDELPADCFQIAVSYIKTILKQYPGLQMVMASGPYYAGDLPRLGFIDLSIQFPTKAQRLELYQLWLRAWNQSNQQNSASSVACQLSSLWMMQESHSQSILEITQQIWTHLAFDHQPGHDTDLFDYITRVTKDLVSFDTLRLMATQIYQQNYIGISHDDLKKLINQDDVALARFQGKPGAMISVPIEQNDADESITSAIETIECLIEENFFVERSGGKLTFGNPSVLSCLLACSPTYSLNTKWKSLIYSPIDLCILGYSPSDKNFVVDWIEDDDPYLYRNLLLAFQQIRKDKQPLKYYPLLAKKVLPLILDESLPATIRFRLFTIFGLDPQSYSQLLERLKKHPSPTVRQMVALGLGKAKNPNAFESLVELISDSDSAVAMAGCLSIYRTYNDNCVDLLVDILINGRDILRSFVAELMAFRPVQGYTILKELAENGNIQSKKAAINGLRLIDDKWANDLLEKISTSDEQWFVRDAAAHALETKWNISYYIPSIRSEPDQTSWLIKIASQKGQSIPAGIYPYELLYRILDSGTLEERLVSLAYLSDKPDEYTGETVIQLMKSDNPLREEAYSTYEMLAKQIK